MEEIISLARECIGEMSKMSPDEIENFHQEWLQRLDDKKNVQSVSNVKHLANYICECALDQVMRKTA